MSDTPRTDAVDDRRHIDALDHLYAMRNHARQLEREKNAMRLALNGMARATCLKANADIMQACHELGWLDADCLTPPAVQP